MKSRNINFAATVLPCFVAGDVPCLAAAAVSYLMAARLIVCLL